VRPGNGGARVPGLGVCPRQSWAENRRVRYFDDSAKMYGSVSVRNSRTSRATWTTA